MPVRAVIAAALKVIEAVAEALYKGALGGERCLCCCFLALDLEGRGVVFEAQEQGAGVFEVGGGFGTLEMRVLEA